MFERAKAQGHNSLHPESKKQIVKNKEKYESKKQERSEHKGAKTEALEKAKKGRAMDNFVKIKDIYGGHHYQNKDWYKAN
jgi:hypothetical protein